jgi:tellurite resistance protein
MPVADAKTLERVAQGLKRSGSILAQAATVYGAKPEQPEATPGTGFDPVAAALFEALIEGAYLVASADGVVDDEERAAFEQVVAAATATGTGAQSGVHALLADLHESLQEDGIDRRVEIVTKSVLRPEHRTEVLRVAALVAQISGGVSAPERALMEKLAVGLELTNGDVDQAIEGATSALAG